MSKLFFWLVLSLVNMLMPLCSQHKEQFRNNPNPRKLMHFIRISYPNGGENLQAQLVDTIRWTSEHISNVKIEYSTDNGSSWSLVAASAPSPATATYAWLVPNNASGSCRIKIKDVAGSTTDISNGPFTITIPNGVTERDEQRGEFRLQQNYPNPFNPSTNITFLLPSAEYTTLKIYSVTGREVATIVNGMKSAGYHSVEFRSGSVEAGIYLYALQSGKFHAMGKMMVLK